MRRVTLGDISKIVSGGTPARNKPEYWGGSIPWIKTGEIEFRCITKAEEHITEEGLENSSARIIPKGTILMAMYGQGKTRGQVAVLGIDAAINQACAAILLNQEAERDFVYQQLAFHYGAIRNLSNGGNQNNLNADLIRSIAFALPSMPEQRKIAAILGVWDRAIQKLEDLVEAKTERLGVLREHLLTGTRRFPNFKKARRRRVCLDEVAEDVSERNAGQFTHERLYAVTKAEGIVPMRDRVKGLNHERCKIVAKDWFAYNPMRLNIGSISRWQEKQPVMVSGDYVVFRCKQAEILPDYLDQVRLSGRWGSFVKAAGNGSVRVRIYFEDLGHFSFSLPSIEEQRRIATVLNACEREITLLESELTALKEQKRGMMEKLLTGKVRVKP